MVTIAVPVRNGEKYVARALDCLLAQTYQNLEILISDNASTDRTYEICQRYLSDPRVTLWRNEQNIGAYGNFDLTLARASGQYFMWAASDDMWSPRFVEALVGELERHPDAGVAKTATERILEGNGRLDLVRHSGKDDPSKMSWLELALAGAAFKGYYLYVYGLFRTDFLRRAFANLPRLVAADRLFFIQLAMATRLRYVDELWNVRQVAARRLEQRYAGEVDASIWSNPFEVWLLLIQTGPYLFRSPLIPWQRKLLIPVIVARLVTPRRLYIGLYGSLSHWAEKRLGPQRHLAIRRRLRRVAGLPPL